MTVFSKLGNKLGFTKSEKQRQADMLEDIETRTRKCHDGLEQLKERIKLLENKARKKKQELDETKGKRRSIVLSELKQLLMELDKLGGQEKILLGQLKKLSTLEARIGEIKVAGELTVNEDVVDDVALGLEEAHDQLTAEDRAVKDLDKIGYDGFEEESDEQLEKQLEELERSLAEEKAEAKVEADASAVEDDISEEMKKQLNELEE